MTTSIYRSLYKALIFLTVVLLAGLYSSLVNAAPASYVLLVNGGCSSGYESQSLYWINAKLDKAIYAPGEEIRIIDGSISYNQGDCGLDKHITLYSQINNGSKKQVVTWDNVLDQLFSLNGYSIGTAPQTPGDYVVKLSANTDQGTTNGQQKTVTVEDGAIEEEITPTPIPNPEPSPAPGASINPACQTQAHAAESIIKVITQYLAYATQLENAGNQVAATQIKKIIAETATNTLTSLTLACQSSTNTAAGSDTETQSSNQNSSGGPIQSTNDSTSIN